MAAARPSAVTRVVAANTDIKLGTILNAGNLKTIEIAGTIPVGAIPVTDEGKVIGRGVISDLYAGEPIMESRLPFLKA
jgi:pilus assembly protein CpaB